MVNKILITGASGGIGGATAKALAKSGASLYLHYNSGKEAVDHLARGLREKYSDQFFICVQADLSREDGPELLLQQIDQQVNGVVYASGISKVSLFQDTESKTIKKMIQLQLTSPFRLLQQLIQPMIRAKSGKILLVSSIWGLEGASTEVLYSMVKGGQNAFVKALAKEAAPSGITVNAVAPGAVDTSMMHLFSPEDIEYVKQEIPMGRLAAPEEVASLINYLMSSEAGYISGQVISINGAWYC
ncbi:elongation factor P 5-aminopentanone reductase [Sporolactobacillus laevolacticus]|uniref:3-ketoacyl-ACP reductase n=1 Tax=Sporolactobacillus laevolacticus DSM 442 TaxID=1395513 RepID=V6J899_9BACL|nr:SDR family oxidoreductase [Sporolactobacillus laevolacticus]EST13019.1 3-ketoacyl-ACP reductase [Sporolactobacillus laevolacticus DSM 442]